MHKHMQHSVGGQKETRPAAPTFAWLYHVPIFMYVHVLLTQQIYYSVYSAENNYVLQSDYDQLSAFWVGN